MVCRCLHLCALVLVLVAFTPVKASTDKPDRPLNVVFILVDDLGWSDLGCFGSDFYDTPAIDQLAKESVMFNLAYAAAPVCSPTRAAILTGMSPARLDMTIWHEGAVDGGPTDRLLRNAKSEPNLPRERTTLAEMFRAAGYRTLHVGKWHLGTAAYYPETQGFDVNVGGTFWGAPSTFFKPFRGQWNKNSPEIRYVPGLPTNSADYLPDALTDAALQLIEQHSEQPFFLDLWFYTVHSPIQAPEILVDHYRSKPSGTHHRDATYAAMVKKLDDNVGRMQQKLQELGLLDRTVIVLTSDNGGVDFAQRGIVPTSNLPLRSGKGTLYEGGLRVPLLIRWPGMSPGETDRMCVSEDFFPTFREMLNTDASITISEPNIDDSQLDGRSLMSTLKGERTSTESRTWFWHFPHYYPRMTPGSAVREGDWKLIHSYENDQHELYNLGTDPGEEDDLHQRQPEIAQRLRQALDAWRVSVGANRPQRAR